MVAGCAGMNCYQRAIRFLARGDWHGQELDQLVRAKYNYVVSSQACARLSPTCSSPQSNPAIITLVIAQTLLQAPELWGLAPPLPLKPPPPDIGISAI